MAVTPRDEAEVILNFDKYTGQWHLYSDVPSLNRKWQDKVSPESITVEDNGTISKIDGMLLEGCSVTVSKRKPMTEEQRQAAAERLQKAREAQNQI